MNDRDWHITELLVVYQSLLQNNRTHKAPLMPLISRLAVAPLIGDEVAVNSERVLMPPRVDDP